jgi:hypothetical protein
MLPSEFNDRFHMIQRVSITNGDYFFYNGMKMIFVTEMQCIYYEVQIEFLPIIYINFKLSFAPCKPSFNPGNVWDL